MNRLASGIRPAGPEHELCPSEEPNEAMADRGPDGRMVPTFLWRALPLRHCRAARPPQGYTPKLKLP
jgi:hypothetical protein